MEERTTACRSLLRFLATVGERSEADYFRRECGARSEGVNIRDLLSERALNWGLK
jgi:hypothetical protein